MLKKTPARFVEIYSQKTEGSTKILLDMVTGVNYLFHQNGYSGGLTVLRNPDGSPVVTPPQQLFPDLYKQG